jgi:ketosteroid isomerase-like protein
MTMFRPLPLFALLLVVAPAAVTMAAQPADEAAVRAVEERRVKALMEDDFATLESIFGDDLHYTHSSAVVDDKASFMTALKTGKTKYENIERGPALVRLYGDTALMTGTALVRLRGRAEPLSLRYTLVYVKRAGEWKMVAWQSTRTQ